MPAPGVQAALSRAASTMLRGRSSNLDAARAEHPAGAASPRSPADPGPPATSGAVTLVSAVEGPDGRLIMDSVQIATPAVVPVNNTVGNPPLPAHAAAHRSSFGGPPAQLEGAADARSRRRLQVGAEPAAPDIRIEMVSPAQQPQRSTTWVSPFANATFWPNSGSAANNPREQNADEAPGAASTVARGVDAV